MARTALLTPVVLVLLVVSSACSDDVRDGSGRVTDDVVLGVFDLREGDCVVDRVGEEFLQRVQVVPCADEHTAEVFHVGTLTTEVYEPVTIDAEVGSACAAAFLDYVGREMDTSELEVYAHTPDVETFAAGERTAVCYVWDARILAAGDDLAESLKGADR